MFSANTTQVSSAINYIEDVFSTWLYTGTGNTLTVTNGIDLSGKGGLVWAKDRTFANENNRLYDTTRGVDKVLFSNATNASSTVGDLSSFNSNGFTVASAATSNINYAPDNPSPHDYVTWTFREQPKFFDVVTYTGNNTTQNISHSLGSTPGCVIVKRTDGAASWFVWHRGQSAGYYSILNTTPAQTNANSAITFGNNTTYVDPTSTQFTVGSNGNVNGLGNTYVAYIFAHNAGGFGLTGTDNVISCGSFTTDGSGLFSVTLGYEPQWVMVKRSSGVGDWIMFDTMRGMPTAAASGVFSATLFANSTNAEDAAGGTVGVNATGFNSLNGYLASSSTFIYIAIRRGPMKVPTLGTSVFQPVTYTGNGTSQSVTTGITGDLTYIKYRTDGGAATFFTDRLRGSSKILESNSSVAEDTSAQHLTSFNQLGFSVGNNGNVNASGGTFISETFKRAPSFFDEVCYTGTGSARTITHNLAAVPELMIVKNRSSNNSGVVYTASGGTGFYLRLFESSSSDSGNTSAGTFWNNTTPTSSVFSVGTANNLNGSGLTYVAYLFATCAGVSKVGSYTGTGSTQTINCGFTGGARFVLIKKSTSTAPDRDWYVWDTARGMVSGTDPSLKLNTTAAEVNADNIYTITTGFQIVSSSDYVNASGVTYIFLAIA